MKIDESKFRFRIGDKVMYGGKEYTVMAYYFPYCFNDYRGYGYTIDLPNHCGNCSSYDGNGNKMSFQSESVHYISEDEVAPAMSIADRLRYAPSGIELYSPFYGNVNFIRVLPNNNIEIKDKISFIITFYEDGKLNKIDDSECLLFPSKENRDWTMVDYSKPKRQDLPTDTLCIVTDGDYREAPCNFRYYALKSTCYYSGKKSDDYESITSWSHIVPVDKFDFKNIIYKPEDDYGTESEYNR